MGITTKTQKATKSSNRQEPLFKTMSSKNEMLRFEAGNYDKIAFLSSGAFWMAMQNSCLFLVNIVQVKNKMHMEYDNYIQRERSYVSCHIAHFADMQELLFRLNCKKIRDDEKVKIYRLPSKVSLAQIKDWKHDDDVKRQKINAYFLPDSGETAVYTYLRKLCYAVVLCTDKMRQSAREVEGREMLSLTLQLLDLYTDIERKMSIEELAEIKRKMLKTIYKFSFLMMSMYDYNLVTDKKMMNMGVILKDLSKELGLGNRVSEKE